MLSGHAYPPRGAPLRTYREVKRLPPNPQFAVGTKVNSFSIFRKKGKNYLVWG